MLLEKWRAVILAHQADRSRSHDIMLTFLGLFMDGDAPMKTYFRNKVCVVTGAASGIGLQLVKDLLKCKAVVFMADINAEQLHDACAALGSSHAHPVVVDVTKDEQVRNLIELGLSHNGRLDVLFNNAGIGATQPWETITLERWRTVLDINLWGVIHGLHYAVPVMRNQGGGHIVNTSSVGGLLNIPFQAVYCASKAAITALGESLRYELADENIHVTTIFPGNVATAIFQTAGAVPDDAVSVEDASEIILQAVSQRKSKIVFPEQVCNWAERVLADAQYQEDAMLEMARQRRHNYKTKGQYF